MSSLHVLSLYRRKIFLGQNCRKTPPKNAIVGCYVAGYNVEVLGQPEKRVPLFKGEFTWDVDLR